MQTLWQSARPLRSVWQTHLTLLAFAWGLVSNVTSTAAEGILLRNLQRIVNPQVTELDEDGLVLQIEGKTSQLTWDQIEHGTLPVNQQAGFDELLAKFGQPLHRLKVRLKSGDLAGATPLAETLYPVFHSRHKASALLVCEAAFVCRVYTGRREEALLPYLEGLEIVRRAVAAKEELPATLSWDDAAGFSPKLAPVWFDGPKCKELLAEVQGTIKKMPSPRPVGVSVYFAAMAQEAGDSALAKKVTDSLPDQPSENQGWKQILLAQQECAAKEPGEAVAWLGSHLSGLTAGQQPLALYWLAKAGITSSEVPRQTDAAIRFASLPALYGKEQPDLAAAGLFELGRYLQQTGANTEAASVRRELQQKFPHTYYGRAVRPAAGASVSVGSAR